MKQLFNSIKIIAIALIIGLGVSYVSAAPWAAPGAAPTGGNTVASVNVSDYAQTKIGSFITENFLKAGGAISPTGAPWNKAGYAVAEKAFISPWSFFTSAFLPGSSSQVKIGGGDDATTDIFNAARTPFTIDLSGRGTGNNSVPGRRVIDIRTDASMCYPNATIRTNTPAVRLLNSKTGDDADAIVRGVQLSGGNPAPGKILVSTDTNGNAVWGTPTLSGGQIVFTYGTSPVPEGQCIAPDPAPKDNDIILPDEVTITGTLSTDKTITEKYQLKLLYPDPYAFSGVSIDYNSIVDSSSLLFQYPSTNVPSTIQSIVIDGTNSIVIKRTVPTVPNSTAITDVINTSFKITIPNMNKTYLIEIKDTNTTGTLDGYWSFHQIAKDGTKVIKTNGTTHASNMPDYSPLSITKTVQ